MSDVLEELADEESGDIDRSHVERRLDDWSDRISRLYTSVEGWLPAGISANRNNSVPVSEELMKKYQVGTRHLPILTMEKNGQWIGKIVPKGLWIIGANGRLDLFVKSSHFILVDRAENFSSPLWMIAPSTNRRLEQKELNSETFLKALNV